MLQRFCAKKTPEKGQERTAEQGAEGKQFSSSHTKILKKLLKNKK